MSPRDVWRILAAMLIFGTLLSVGSLFVFEGSLTGGVVAGATLGALNFYWLIRLGRGLMDDKPGRGRLALRFVLKYGVVGALVAFVLLVLRVDPLGFLIGLSTLFAAVLLYGAGALGHAEPEA